MIHRSKVAKLPVLCLDLTEKNPDFKEFNKLEKLQKILPGIHFAQKFTTSQEK
jgi:hypothetical protein